MKIIFKIGFFCSFFVFLSIPVFSADSEDLLFSEYLARNPYGSITVNPVGSFSNPIESCAWLKKTYPSYPSGVYWWKTNTMTSAREVYCEQNLAGGGRMLLFQRRAGANNVESCGRNLNEFLHSDCGSPHSLHNSDSYSLDVDKVYNDLRPNNYLFIQYTSNANNLSDDSYRINAKENLFPNTILLKKIPYEKICDYNGENCDSSDGIWRYIGNNFFFYASCQSGPGGDIRTKGLYGYCHNGNGDYLIGSLFGSREGYDEGKAWGYSPGSNYVERVFVKNIPEIIGELSLFSPGEIYLNYQVKGKTDDYIYSFPDYIGVKDTLGQDTGRYTTLSISNFVGPSPLSASNFWLKVPSSSLEVLSGDVNPNISIESSFVNSYASLVSSKTFIQKKSAPSYGRRGTYAIKPSLKVRIPAYQQPGSYKGELYFTLYNY